MNERLPTVLDRQARFRTIFATEWIPLQRRATLRINDYLRSTAHGTIVARSECVAMQRSPQRCNFRTGSFLHWLCHARLDARSLRLYLDTRSAREAVTEDVHSVFVARLFR